MSDGMPKNMNNPFWIFGSLGLGDHIVCCSLYRYFSSLYPQKVILIVCWPHNMAALQWLLSDCKNVYFYPVETEQQLLTCKEGNKNEDKLCLGFYSEEYVNCDIYCSPEKTIHTTTKKLFNPVLWDSEFYRQAGLPASLKWEGFLLPSSKPKLGTHRSYIIGGEVKNPPYVVRHQDIERGFTINMANREVIDLDKTWSLEDSVCAIRNAYEIHCIDSSILNLVDLMAIPNNPRLVFHKYARKGLPPRLKKNWEIIE